MKIVHVGEKSLLVNYVWPPIPIRSFDWSAYETDADENSPVGWGRTEEEAIADLLRQIEEANDDGA